MTAAASLAVAVDGVLDPTRVAAARYWAAERFPYLTGALLALTVVSAPCGGAKVDQRWRLYLDAGAVGEWTVAQLGSVMVHHVGHLLRDHGARGRAVGVGPEPGTSSGNDWLLAADLEIDDDLTGSGLSPPVAPVLPGDRDLEPGHLAEEYYRALRRERGEDPGDRSGPDGSAGGCGSGADGCGRPWDLDGASAGGVESDQADLLRRQVAGEVAAAASRSPGTVPLGLSRWAATLLPARLDWRRVLAAEIRLGLNRAAGQVDYTYQRRSRRAGLAGPVILPGLYQPVPEVAVVCDTSGSVTDDDLARMLAEVDGILRAAGRAGATTVLGVDASVHTVQRVAEARHLRLAGGGGTDMGVGLAAAGSLRPRPSVVVVLTDGFTPWPVDAPRAMSVVVALVGGGRLGPPWARTVVVDP